MNANKELEESLANIAQETKKLTRCSTRLSVDLNETEYSKWQSIAKLYDINFTSFVRTAIGKAYDTCNLASG